MDSLRALWDRLGGWPRRLAALACLTMAGLTLFASHRAAATASTQVVVAAHPLAAGAVLGAGDVRLAAWPPDVAFTGLTRLSDANGRTVAGPVGAGEPLTAGRLLGPGLAAGLPPGFVAATVRLADDGASGLIRPGDSVDLLAAADDNAMPPTSARTVAQAVRVLAVLPIGNSDGPATELVVGVDQVTALRLADALGTPILATVRVPP